MFLSLIAPAQEVGKAVPVVFDTVAKAPDGEFTLSAPTSDGWVTFEYKTSRNLPEGEKGSILVVVRKGSDTPKTSHITPEKYGKFFETLKKYRIKEGALMELFRILGENQSHRPTFDLLVRTLAAFTDKDGHFVEMLGYAPPAKRDEIIYNWEKETPSLKSKLKRIVWN